MLEASGFDFRNRYPQKLLLKLARHYSVDRATVGKTAYNMSLDLYRTLAPLKQTAATMAVSCVELAGRLWDHNVHQLEAQNGYQDFRITRTEVMGELHSDYAHCSLLPQKYLIQVYRDTSRLARSVHPPPNINDHRAGPFSRKIHRHPDRVKSGGFVRCHSSSYSG